MPLPLSGAHWDAIFAAMRLSKRQREIAELALRDATNKQIDIVLDIRESTIKEQLDRIANKIGKRGRMALAMHVLELSHQVKMDLD